MFARIFQWLREVWSKMLNQTSVKQAMGIELAVSAPMLEALQLWSSMYENTPPWLVSEEGNIVSLNLASAIASEISRSVTIEMEVEVIGSARALYLNEQLDAVTDKLRIGVEVGAAKGGLVMKPYISGDKIIVDFVQADQFYPVAFDATGKITSCIFVDQRTIGGNYYTRLEFHSMGTDSCEITNRAYKSSTRDTLGTEVPLETIPAWAELEPQATITSIEHPLFSYFRYPLANNIDSTSPLGVSCYSRAVDQIKEADVQWTDFLWEFESGKRALYVDELSFSKDSAGKPILPIKRLYRTLVGATEVGGKTLFEDWSPTFRQVELLAGLDAILRKIEFNCGLAYGTLSNPTTVDKTATELKISNQRSYATITDTQKSLEEALEDLLYAMDIWATIGKLAPAGAYEVTYVFDDSIVVDKDAQFQQDLRLVTSQIMSRVEFRMRNFGEDKETAEAKLAEVEIAQTTDFFGNPVGGSKPPFGKPKTEDKKADDKKSEDKK
jgi:A118 family predicted phage portal protein